MPVVQPVCRARARACARAQGMCPEGCIHMCKSPSYAFSHAPVPPGMRATPCAPQTPLLMLCRAHCCTQPAAARNLLQSATHARLTHSELTTSSPGVQPLCLQRCHHHCPSPVSLTVTPDCDPSARAVYWTQTSGTALRAHVLGCSRWRRSHPCSTTPTCPASSTRFSRSCQRCGPPSSPCCDKLCRA